MQANGRVDLLSKRPQLDIYHQPNTTVNNESFCSEAIRGQIERNPVSDIFFSSKNIDALQQGIRYRIYVESKGRYNIGRQSDTELKIIMRSIYIEYAKGDPIGVIEQVRELNARVLNYAVPNVLSNVKQYEQYRIDASMMPVPMDRGELATNKGSRSLEMKPYF